MEQQLSSRGRRAAAGGAPGAAPALQALLVPPAFVYLGLMGGDAHT